MGKGEINARPLVDYNATDGKTFGLIFMEHEHCTSAEFNGLVDASTGQSAFDTEAASVFGTWYSNAPSAHKTAAYEVFRAVRLSGS